MIHVSTKELTAAIILSTVLNIGCEAGHLEIPEENSQAVNLMETPVDTGYYEITSMPGKDFIGASMIPRRALRYSLKQSQLPKVMFASYGDNEIKARLTSESAIILGEKTKEEELIDNGSTISITTNEGFSWCAKETGALTMKRYVPTREATVVKNGEDAVNRALEKIAESGLLRMHEHETLDIVSIAATKNAGWVRNDDVIEPVHFYFEGVSKETEEAVTEYTSDYTVYFGRRYRGVPIIGPTLAVRLDHNGEMVALMKVTVHGVESV